MNELVSVLMCVHNTAVDYLQEAIDSILDQNYTPIEFIIINDSSDDILCLDCLTLYASKYDCIKLVHNDVNQGLTKSLNIGLEYCKGQYIARMDSDDISLPDRISKQADYLRTHRDVALVGSNVICFGSGMEDRDTSIEPDVCADYEIYRIQSLLKHSGPPHPSFMFRADFLSDKGIKYREDIRKAQDYGIMADILKSGGKIDKIHEPLLRYRIHDKQISTSSEKEQKIYQLRISYDYIRSVFCNLSNKECLALSLLGCDLDIEEICNSIEKDRYLNNCFCDFSVDMDSLKRKELYIEAQKKAIAINKQQRLFDDNKLQNVFRYEWWKKALHTSPKDGKAWILNAYTLLSYRYVIQRKRNGF